MKTNLCLAFSTALLAAGAAWPQASIPLRAEIPFPFAVGSKVLQAGEYVVKSNTVPGAILVQSADGKDSALIQTHGLLSAGAGHTDLIFHRYGNEYFLSQVWEAQCHCGNELPRPKRERELMAEQTVYVRTISIASR